MNKRQKKEIKKTELRTSIYNFKRECKMGYRK